VYRNASQTVDDEVTELVKNDRKQSQQDDNADTLTHCRGFRVDGPHMKTYENGKDPVPVESQTQADFQPEGLYGLI
jgi:hypothetical protein